MGMKNERRKRQAKRRRIYKMGLKVQNVQMNGQVRRGREIKRDVE